MTIKWIGAILIIAGCGWFGFSMALLYRKEEQMLKQLIKMLEYMECELGYRMIPLPQLFQNMADLCDGGLKRVFQGLSQELDSQISPDAGCCMNIVLSKFPDLPGVIHRALSMLGLSLGKFDLEGQLGEIASVKAHCQGELVIIRDQRDNRVRSYQTLGLCAGAALAILFI